MTIFALRITFINRLMKRVLFVILAILLTVPAMAQREPSPKKACISAGVLQGGGGIIGADFEYLFSEHFSAQVGAGLVSYGGAFNYHFKPFINSSMLSLCYFHQGIGNSYSTSWLGPTFTYRAPKIFQAQTGMGYQVGIGPAASEQLKKSKLGLLYSIGVYFPL